MQSLKKAFRQSKKKPKNKALKKKFFTELLKIIQTLNYENFSTDELKIYLPFMSHGVNIFDPTNFEDHIALLEVFRFLEHICRTEISGNLEFKFFQLEIPNKILGLLNDAMFAMPVWADNFGKDEALPLDEDPQFETFDDLLISATEVLLYLIENPRLKKKLKKLPNFEKCQKLMECFFLHWPTMHVSSNAFGILGLLMKPEDLTIEFLNDMQERIELMMNTQMNASTKYQHVLFNRFGKMIGIILHSEYCAYVASNFEGYEKFLTSMEYREKTCPEVSYKNQNKHGKKKMFCAFCKKMEEDDEPRFKKCAAVGWCFIALKNVNVKIGN